MSKPGAKENLIPGQEVDINKMFYRDFMINYFDQKVILLVDLLKNPKDHFDRILSNELSIGNLKFKLDNKLDNSVIEKFAKCELVDTYYHCLETFIRLFIAHASFENCPLIELTDLDNREYRKKLNQIATGHFEYLNDKYSEDDTILMVLLGIKKGDNYITKKQLDNLKSWIIMCAIELKEVPEYNSFKHGLTMFSGFGAVCLTDAETGEKLLSKEGESVHILEKKEDDIQYRLNIKNIFVEHDFKVALIMYYSEMIKNIIQIGNIRYVSNEQNPTIDGLHFTEYDYHELRNMFYDKNDIGNTLSSYSSPLFYYNDTDDSNP